MSNSFAIPWTVACQAPLSMGFPRQEYLSGLPFPFPGNLPNTGIKPMSPELVDGFFPIEPPGKSKDFRRCSQSLGLFFSSFSHVWVPCAVKMRPRDNIVNAGASNIFKNMVVDPYFNKLCWISVYKTTKEEMLGWDEILALCPLILWEQICKQLVLWLREQSQEWNSWVESPVLGDPW